MEVWGRPQGAGSAHNTRSREPSGERARAVGEEGLGGRALRPWSPDKVTGGEGVGRFERLRA